MEKLKDRLSQPEGFGSYSEIQRWLAEGRELELPHSTACRIVRYDLEAKPKSPRPSHQKRKPEQVAFGRASRGGPLGPNRRDSSQGQQAGGLVLPLTGADLACDGSRPGLMPTTRRRITLSGVKPIRQQRPADQSYYLYGAVEPKTEDRFFSNVSRPSRESLGSDGFQDFLDAFTDRFSESLNVLVLDNGQFHKAKAPTIPDDVQLIFLPPYSPELNPVERLWQDLKDYLGFHLHESLSPLKQRAWEKLQTYTDEAVASLTRYEYLPDAARAWLFIVTGITMSQTIMIQVEMVQVAALSSTSKND